MLYAHSLTYLYLSILLFLMSEKFFCNKSIRIVH